MPKGSRKRSPDGLDVWEMVNQCLGVSCASRFFICHNVSKSKSSLILISSHSHVFFFTWQDANAKGPEDLCQEPAAKAGWLMLVAWFPKTLTD